ncbi:hypothetical protein IWW46_002888 [Coemansia sp. RSA 2440]|nr:hypothetical protein IWW46_002888 [Coemansia sp. RSA 2440]
MTLLRPSKRMLALVAVVVVVCIHIVFYWKPAELHDVDGMHRVDDELHRAGDELHRVDDGLHRVTDRPHDDTNGPHTEFPSLIHHHMPIPLSSHWSLLDKLFGPSTLATKCHDIPIPSYYWTAKDAFTPAFVALPNAQPIQVGSTVCVRVIVPAKPQRASVVYTPMPDTPWDSILIDMVGTTNNVSVPVRLQMTNDVRNTRRDDVHVYEADVELRDADEYRPRGYIEFRDAEWNPDGGLLPVDYVPEPLYVPESARVEAVDDGSSMYSLDRYLELPLCTDPAAEGRWIHTDMLPFDPHLVPEPENHNLVWLPYTCRLQRITYTDFASCLATAYPLMHWYGDSNLRRSLKKIVSMGDWCSFNSTSNATETRSCLCEDYQDPFMPFDARYRELIIDIDQTGGQALMQPTEFALVPDNTARVYLHKWEGLSTRNKPAWTQGFDARITPQYGNPQVALISLTNWDAAFSSRAYFAVEMQKLLDYVQVEYSNYTQLYIRTGQYYCCRTDQTPNAPRAYSRLRNAYFDQYVIDAFRERFGHSHVIRIWNVAQVSERLPLSVRKETVKCPANHARAEVVEIENQILMNAMCNYFEPYVPMEQASVGEEDDLETDQ